MGATRDIELSQALLGYHLRRRLRNPPEEATVTRQAMTTVERDFHERMHAAQMYGLWELASQMTRHPEPQAIAHMWKASLIEAMVRESGEVVPSARSGARSSSSIQGSAAAGLRPTR